MSNNKLLFIGLEGADWRLIMHYVDQGLMPNMEGLINKSSIGKTFSIQPNMSTTLWASMFTGKRPHKHGIIGIKEFDQEIIKLRPIDSSKKKCSDVWEILEHVGKKVHRIGLSVSHPAKSQNGITVSNYYTKNEISIDKDRHVYWQPMPESVFPKQLESTFSKLRIYHTEVVDQYLKDFVHSKFKGDNILAETYVLNKMIADNLSILSAATYAIEHEPFDVCAVMFDGIERMCFRYLEGGLESVKTNETTIISLCYVLFDTIIGHLSSKISDDDHLIISSEYGYNAMRIRNRPRTWDKAAEDKEHNSGFVLFKGPNIKRDFLCNNSSILNVAPSILKMNNLPCDIEMDGTKDNIFVENEPLQEPIDWEARIGKYKNYNEEFKQGYLREANKEHPEDSLKAKNKKNYFFWLAKSYSNARDFDTAILILKTLLKQYPHESRFIFHLSRIYNIKGDHENSLSILDSLQEDGDYKAAKSFITQAMGLIKYRKIDEAMERLRQAELKSDKYPVLLQDISKSFLQIGKTVDAERVLLKSSRLETTDYNLKTSLARVYMLNNKNEEALNAINESIALRQFQPMAHFLRGEVLCLLNEKKDAARSYEMALSQKFDFQKARLSLINLYKHEPNLKEAYNMHLSQFLSSIKSTKNLIICSSFKEISTIKESLGKNKIAMTKTDLIINAKRGGFYFKNEITSLLNQSNEDLIFVLARYVLDFPPNFIYNLIFIKPDPNEIKAEKVSLEKVVKNIEKLEKKLLSWAEYHPNANLKILQNNYSMEELLQIIHSGSLVSRDLKA